MPLIHVRTFRVRHYECDPYGHVNQANYLRYMQEAAFDATAAAGYSFSRYQEMRRLWLVRETEVEYLAPLRYGQEVEVRTWVADFRRVRSRRAYELREPRWGILVARATTDWVFLDMDTNHPVEIPPEMIRAFVPEGIPSTMPVRRRFPPPPPVPSGAFRQHRRVEWRDLDGAQHVNNAAYVSYVEDCAIQAVSELGWPVHRISSEGCAIVARHHRIVYRQPAVLDDRFELCTWLSDASRSSIVRHCTITRASDRAPVAQTRTVLVFLGLGSGRPVPIPHRFVSDLAPQIAGA